MTIQNQDTYEAALQEIESGAMHRGLWARAFADADEDDSKAKARYIRLRVEQAEDNNTKHHAKAVADEKKKLDDARLSLNTIILELNQKGYAITPKGKGWHVREPLGGRMIINSLAELFEYAAGRVNISKEEREKAQHLAEASPPAETPSAKVTNIVGNSEGSNPKVLAKLLAGDYGLARTYWLFGVLPNVLLAPLRLINNPELSLLLALPLLGYGVVVAIGVWRSASRYQGPAVWGVLAKLAIVFGILVGVLQLAVKAN